MSTTNKSSVAEPVYVTVRERLLTAALTMFNAKGYEGASVREIVAAAGVSKPALYYYFKNKNGIYLELVRRAQDLFQKVILQNTPFQETVRNQLKFFCIENIRQCYRKQCRCLLCYDRHI